MLVMMIACYLLAWPVWLCLKGTEGALVAAVLCALFSVVLLLPALMLVGRTAAAAVVDAGAVVAAVSERIFAFNCGAAWLITFALNGFA